MSRAYREEFAGLVLPRVIQGVLLGSVAYWLLESVMFASSSPDGTMGWRLPAFSFIVIAIGTLLATRVAYRWLGIGFILAAVGWTIYNAIA